MLRSALHLVIPPSRVPLSAGSEFFSGDVDDLGFFGGVLSDADVQARWNESLSNRLAEGLEPNLILFWNFNDAREGTALNLGTAGSDYDLLLGRLGRALEYAGGQKTSDHFFPAKQN